MPHNYYNAKEEPLYVLHFPGNGFIGHQNILLDNAERKIKVSDKLSIISIMNRSCFKNSILAKQCDLNHIKLYNTALEEDRWNNTIKIRHILQCLSQIDTDYALILDGRDTLIVNDLTDTFIEQYHAFHSPVIYNGTPAPYPNVIIESLQELLSIPGKQKYLNAGVCMGARDSLISFYTRAEEINKTQYNNHSEQYIIRLTRKLYPKLAAVDSENSLFRIIHQYDTVIKEIDGKKIIF